MPLPDAGPRPAREPLRRRRHARPLRPRPRASPRCCAAIRRDRGAARERRGAASGARVRPRPRDAALPRAGRVRGGRARVQGAHPAGRRLPDRALAARRAADLGVSALELYRSLRRVNPSPYLFLLELDGLALVGSSPETLVKCEGTRASLNPIAGIDAPRRGRRRAAARLREGSRRARDARRPRPQRPLARLRARDGAGRALPRGRALLARHAPRLGGRRASCARASRRSTCCARASRPARSRARRRCARCRSSPSSRATAAGPYAGAVALRAPGRRARHVHRDPDDRARTTASRYLQAGAGIVADSDPAAEHEECLRKLAALEAAIDLAEAR